MESILDGVPTSASSLHKAMREWRDKCIDIPVLARKLEAAHATSGLLQEECKQLRDKLVQKEETTRQLTKKQQQLLGSHDSTHNEVRKNNKLMNFIIFSIKYSFTALPIGLGMLL